MLSHAGLVSHVDVKIIKRKDVALSRLKMDYCCHKLLLFFHEVLSAVGILEQECCYIFFNFGAMSLVAKKPLEGLSL